MDEQKIKAAVTEVFRTIGAFRVHAKSGTVTFEVFGTVSLTHLLRLSDALGTQDIDVNHDANGCLVQIFDAKVPA